MCFTRVIITIFTAIETIERRHEECIFLTIIKAHCTVFGAPGGKFHAVKARFCHLSHVDYKVNRCFRARHDKVRFYLFKAFVELKDHLTIVVALLLIPIMQLCIGLMLQSAKDILAQCISAKVCRIFRNRFFIAQFIIRNDGSNAKPTRIPNLTSCFKANTATFDARHIFIG